MRYAILYVGTEYNDEGYDVGGDDAKIYAQTYATKQEAQEGLKEHYRELLSDFDLTDFSQYSYSTGIEGYLKTFHGSEWHYGVKWTEYIDYKEKVGEDWMKDVPPLLKISEIEVDQLSLWGCNSAVEFWSFKPRVAGSNPVTPTQ